MTNVMANEILTEEQLNQVAGGNYKELDELASAINDNLFLKSMAVLTLMIPGGGKLLAPEITKILDKIGIKADIDVNFMGAFGFGIGEKNNTYKDKFTGESLTHKQVIKIIENFVG